MFRERAGLGHLTCVRGRSVQPNANADSGLGQADSYRASARLDTQPVASRWTPAPAGPHTASIYKRRPALHPKQALALPLHRYCIMALHAVGSAWLPCSFLCAECPLLCVLEAENCRATPRPQAFVMLPLGQLAAAAPRAACPRHMSPKVPRHMSPEVLIAMDSIIF